MSRIRTFSPSNLTTHRMQTQTCEITAARILAAFNQLRLGGHGNAVETMPGQLDVNRPLSMEGIRQARAIGKEQEGEHFDLVATSPAIRAQETAKFAAGRVYNVGTIESLGINVEDQTNPLTIMFNELNYASLGTYFAHQFGDELKAWAMRVLTEIVEMAERAKPSGHAKVFIVGHAVCHPAIAWTIGDIFKEGVSSGSAFLLRKHMLDMHLGEAEVISLVFGHTALNDFYIITP